MGEITEPVPAESVPSADRPARLVRDWIASQARFVPPVRRRSWVAPPWS